MGAASAPPFLTREALLADLLADRILLPVQLGLLRLGDVAVMAGGHVALFLSDAAVFAMQLRCLCFRHFSLLYFLIDAFVFVIPAFVHPVDDRFVLVPLRVVLSGPAD